MPKDNETMIADALTDRLSEIQSAQADIAQAQMRMVQANENLVRLLVDAKMFHLLSPRLSAMSSWIGRTRRRNAE